MAVKILVLISGSGTNLQALIDATKDGQLKGTITKVISSSPSAYGLQRAENHIIPTHVHSLQKYYKGIPKENKQQRAEARDKFNSDLADYIIGPENKPDMIVCAGWMLILSKTFLDKVEVHDIPIINLHPALPGQFAGTNAIERAWQAGQSGEISKAGVMIHHVIAAVDEGEPLVVKELDLIKGESLEDYTARVHDIEHIAIVEGAQKVVDTLSSRQL
jgi:phosphoribosylglycinamide formyltransferase